jgi:F-type H+-transporting ATPase subunit gamma
MQTRDTLARRLNTLRSLQGVVRGMKMLSMVNEVPFTRAAATIDAYHATVLDGLQIVLRGVPPPPSMPVSKTTFRVAILFGSDHGLCGAYNEGVVDAAEPVFAAGVDYLIAVGARMAMILSPAQQPQRMLTPPASVDGIERFAREALIALDAASDLAADGETHVSLVHMRREPQGRHAPRLTTLLPLDSAFLGALRRKPWISRSLPSYSMDPRQLFASLVRQHLFASLFKTAAEAMSCENTARLELMRQAERAIDERATEIDAVLRMARQSGITSELLDVIAGMNATDTADPEAAAARQVTGC